jgi:hypothetical protein
MHAICELTDVYRPIQEVQQINIPHRPVTVLNFSCPHMPLQVNAGTEL